MYVKMCYYFVMALEIPEQLFVGEVALKAFIEHEGKLLLSLDVGQTNWDSPGGRLHFGENPIDGLKREVKEEIGVDIDVGEPFYTEVFQPINTNKSLRPRFLVAYRATLVDPDQPFVLAPDEIAEVRWVTREEVDSLPLWEEYKRTLEAYFGH